MMLDVTVGDWAFWDDTYRFVQNPSAEYINSNLSDSTFITNKLSIMMFINNSAEIVYSKGFDLRNKKEVDIPESFREMARKKTFHFEFSSKNVSKSGFISVPEGLFLIASRPILTSNYDGPAKGALVMARKFDDTELSTLSDITQLQLTLKHLGELPEHSSLRAVPNVKDSLIGKSYGKDSLTGFAVLKDIFDQQIMLLGVTAKRDIIKQGLNTLYIYTAVIFAVTLSFSLLILCFLHRMILSPLASLSAAVQKISASGDLAGRIPVAGNNEVSSLASEINKMLSALENTQRELKESKARYRHLSYHDTLTGLYNRTFFEEEMARLNEELKNHAPLSIICVDIDGLKLTNDTLGHRAGDDLLISFARLLTKPFRKTDTIARIGGDEFCIILPETTKETAQIKAGEIIKLIEQYNGNCSVIPISVSVGVATSQGSEGESVYDIYQAADNNMYQYKLSQAGSPKSKVIDLLLEALTQRDFVAQGHVERLVDMAERMAARLGLSENKKRDLVLLAKVHDLGKVGIPDNILYKPGKLTSEEYKKMKEHPLIGYNIANRSSELAHIANLILHHHEHWDGGGYPDGLRGEEIPLECRILAVIDAYDAMTNTRPYHQGISKEEAIKELKNCSGKQFDPRIIEEFVALLKEISPHLYPSLPG